MHRCYVFRYIEIWSMFHLWYFFLYIQIANLFCCNESREFKYLKARLNSYGTCICKTLRNAAKRNVISVLFLPKRKSNQLPWGNAGKHQNAETRAKNISLPNPRRTINRERLTGDVTWIAYLEMPYRNNTSVPSCNSVQFRTALCTLSLFAPIVWVVSRFQSVIAAFSHANMDVVLGGQIKFWRINYRGQRKRASSLDFNIMWHLAGVTYTRRRFAESFEENIQQTATFLLRARIFLMQMRNSHPKVSRRRLSAKKRHMDTINEKRFTLLH